MSIAALVRYSEGDHPTLVFESDLAPPSLDREHPDLYEVTTPDGHLLARSSNHGLEGGPGKVDAETQPR